MTEFFGRLARIGLLLAAVPAAQAQTCTPREYQQYKDETATPAGRVSVAFGYCTARVMRAASFAGSRAHIGCEAEMGKAMDALIAAKDPAALQFARGECKGPVPPVK